MLINLWDTSVACRVSGHSFHSIHLINNRIGIWETEDGKTCKWGDAARHVSTTGIHDNWPGIHSLLSPEVAYFQLLTVKLHPENCFLTHQDSQYVPGATAW